MKTKKELQELYKKLIKEFIDKYGNKSFELGKLTSRTNDPYDNEVFGFKLGQIKMLEFVLNINK